jgi:hypothetical protein
MAEIAKTYLKPGFHIAWDKSYGSKKPFFPGAKRIAIRDFQAALKTQKGKLEISLSLIENKKYGLGKIVFLKRGRPLLEAVSNPAKRNELTNSLYIATIDPVFFTEALHLIATKATDLKPLLEKVLIQKLGRGSIKKALNEKKIERTDIGESFQLFSEHEIPKRLEILEKLGVLVLKKGASLPKPPPPKKPETPPFLKETRPRPPIRRVQPEKKEPIIKEETSPTKRKAVSKGQEGHQLDFFQ